MARPSVYTKGVTDHICQRIVDGESLRQICKDDSLPNCDTIYCWLQSNKAFSDQYTQARMLSLLMRLIKSVILKSNQINQ
ncbi:terminase small subunit-like protein [Commensalibacter communis]|uniref:terminase small subunit-like protein n=1 Tax=Commensalibacter communis TaxID=2972786 RepID=UPI0022FFBEAC|nr:hypothetical protein [Commensalibacter communis]CAI3949824.1 unnamed protein product [Commensalibacter communis]CAI3956679.1 unnamed protein product [Commensalibacter communis]